MINCSKAQSSFREFCSGVPVIRILWLVVNSMRALYRRASSFFSLWASSTTKQHQLIVPNVCWVRIIRVSFDCFINFRAQIETKQTNKQTHKQTIINNKFILWFILDSYSSVMKYRTTFFNTPCLSIRFHRLSEVHWIWGTCCWHDTIHIHGSVKTKRQKILIKL